MAKTGIHQQIRDTGLVLHQGAAEFDELFADTEAFVNRRGGAAEARPQAALLTGIGIESLLLGAMLVAHIDGKAVSRKRRLEAVLTKIAGDIRVRDARRVAAIGRAVQIQVLQSRRGDAAVDEDVVRHARWSADAHGIRRGTLDLQSVGDAGEVQVLLIVIEKG